MKNSGRVSSAVLAFSALLGVGAASAADLPVKALPPVEPIFNWTGLYIGGNVGGEWDHYRDPFSVGGTTAFGITETPGTVPLSSNNSSVTGGGQIGYRWQQPGSQWVGGVEADFNWADLKRTQTLTAGLLSPTTGVFVPGDSLSTKTDFQSSIRGNLGLTFDRLLWYVTGGVAFANTQASANFIQTTSGGVNFPASSGSQTKTLVGGTVGTGLTYALNKNWDIGAEYRFTSYGASDYGLGSVAAIGSAAGVFFPVPASTHLSLTTNEVRFRLNYRFDWLAPVVARY
ncbi:outer membrane beta-barrel protein [Bradyrhizobium sp. S69]|uniref:outer membrane protein n=1 Tax=Bradyrhizobium sp. S69 TaxID=1641856 RepID=UPI00131C244A|nr:outer membrane beta-barrel protein [Bradyrhizobium sp. S69]